MAYLASLSMSEFTSSSSSSSVSSTTATTTTSASWSTPAFEVVGLEGVGVALEEFIGEHPSLEIAPVVEEKTSFPFEVFSGRATTLWKGDYFDLEKRAAAVGTFDAIYDRASLVAIEPGLRKVYCRILDDLLEVGGRILLVALDRVAPGDAPEGSLAEAATKKGPPYSVPEAVVRELFGRLGKNNSDTGGSDCYNYSVELLESTNLLETNPDDRKRFPDLHELLETVYLIRKEPLVRASLA